MSGIHVSYLVSRTHAHTFTVWLNNVIDAAVEAMKKSVAPHGQFWEAVKLEMGLVNFFSRITSRHASSAIKLNYANLVTNDALWPSNLLIVSTKIKERSFRTPYITPDRTKPFH